MSRVCEPPRAVYAAAAEALADRVVRALCGADDAFGLAEQLRSGDALAGLAGLAAVRVLGPDALAPYAVAGHRFTPEDAEVIAASIATFPTPEPHPDSHSGSGNGGGGGGVLPVGLLRDWALGRVLRQLGVEDVADVAAEFPALTGSDSGPEPGWLAWSGALAQLSALASPGLACPVHQQARRRGLDTARGVTRAVLRRDYLTAARLTRWLTVADVAGDPGGLMAARLRPEPVLEHLELVGGADPRLRLEITMARRCAAETGTHGRTR